MKTYTNAPLPFQGQKRRFAKQIAEMAKQQKKGSIFVDLFGGSGLVSHIVKYARPECRVVYNDYDNYQERLKNVHRTNAMLHSLRPILENIPHKMRIDEPTRSKVIAEVERWNKSGYVDWITLSSNLHFTMNYSRNFEEFRKETLYNKLRQTDYIVDGYLENVEVVSLDYRELFERFKLVPDVVFIVDPPYLSTDCSTYNNADYWRLSDYLDVLKCLQETNFVYFTSSRSSVLELIEWISHNKFKENPFNNARIFRMHVGGIALNYDDIMIVKAA